MKFFLSFTAVIETLTGIGILFFPGFLVSFLLQKKYDDVGGIIVAMVAGGAIISLATGSWLFRNNDSALTFSKVLLVYNAVIVVIVLFSSINFEFASIPFFLIGGFHLFQALWGLKLLLYKRVYN
ncbi:MAG TPA: hypothetical protein VK711_07950 [Puia sp.]|jgi:hypothetical protein|nr:hypothetical protein [Puia sp.]